jgi:hypothetical protein
VPKKTCLLTQVPGHNGQYATHPREKLLDATVSAGWKNGVGALFD